MFTRRELLKRSALLSLSPVVPAFLARSARAAVAERIAAYWSSCNSTGATTD